MARPQKKGLDYFPFDVDFFTDDKIEAISGEFGIKGELAVIRLLCAVYQNGYFAVWDELKAAQLARRITATSDLVDNIVHRLVRWGFFDESLFNSAKVLTSTRIQTTYFEATSRRKLTDSDLPHLLISVGNNRVNVNINPPSTVLSESNNPQSKVNKIKVNKISISSEIEERERFEFFEIFFFKNYINPENERERFINHYSARGWVPNNSTTPVKNKVALAKAWKEETKDAKCPRRFSQEFLDAWHRSYMIAKVFDADEAKVLLTDLAFVELANNKLCLGCSKELAKAVENTNNGFLDSLKSILKIENLRYKVKK